MQALFDNLAAISRLVDQGAWLEADRLLARHDAMVRAAHTLHMEPDEDTWRELLRRQRELSLKFAAMHGDVAQCIDDLRRSRAVARRYLAELPS